jgi:hypothetical protein
VKYSVLPVSKHGAMKTPERLMQGPTHCQPRSYSSPYKFVNVGYVSDEYKHNSDICMDFLFPKTFLGSPTFVFVGYRGLFSARVKRLGCETDLSLPYSDEVRNEWNCISTAPLYLSGMHRDNSTFIYSTCYEPLFYDEPFFPRNIRFVFYENWVYIRSVSCGRLFVR